MILFVEYAVERQHRAAYMEWVRAEPRRWNGVELLENTAQPGVIVELRRVKSEAEAAEIEKERREGRSGWEAMTPWIKGGREGLRIWTFVPVTG
ncbi:MULTISPECIES: hypothetical protein [Cohnella]|uniref:hypothetical protein n=1 Tax=Cohnella TaxID=329857 RepID=UPI0009BB5049|nr:MULTISPECIES: hypothetical protein [Cohnella]MBN2982821.1 hypothetical protein [Cohnella algarum]